MSEESSFLIGPNSEGRMESPKPCPPPPDPFEQWWWLYSGGPLKDESFKLHAKAAWDAAIKSTAACR